MAEENQREPNPWEANNPQNTDFHPKPPPASSYALQLQKLAVGAVVVNIAVTLYYFVTVAKNQEETSLMSLLLLVVYPVVSLWRGMNPQKTRTYQKPTTERGWWRYYEIQRRCEFVLALWWGGLSSALLLLTAGLGWNISTIWFFIFAATPAYIIQAAYKKRLEKSTAHLE